MKSRKLAVISAGVLTVAVTLIIFSGRGTTTKAALAMCSVPSGTYPNIQSAVNDPGCATINVAPGGYVESVNITRSVTLNGAQAGNAVAGRTFAAATESTVTGKMTIQASDVTVDGFSMTNPNQGFGIVVKTAGNGASLKNNIIDGIGAATFSSNAQAIYLETGPDNVSIVGNAIRNVSSGPSAKGIYIGDTASSDSALNIVIDGNSIANISSTTRGAYGIQVNNGAPSQASTTVTITNNVLNNLTGGGWVHAIGLEGDTPGVVVEGNSITNITDLGPPTNNDCIAVWFEDNASFGTAEVHNNNLAVGSTNFGIAVHPALSAANPTGMVDAECNWWGAANGPSGAGSGAGSMVSPSVDYSPWNVAPAPAGACAGQKATNKDQCKDGGWQFLFRANGTAFKNQGDCIQYVNTGK